MDGSVTDSSLGPAPLCRHASGFGGRVRVLCLAAATCTLQGRAHTQLDLGVKVIMFYAFAFSR